MFNQPFGEVGVVGRALAADADVFVQLAAGFDGQVQHHFHRRIALVEGAGNRAAAVAVYADGELGHVVGADGEAVEVFQILFGQDGVGGQFAHHNQAQAVFAAFQTIFFQCFHYGFGFMQGAHEGNHDFHVGEPHFVAHVFQSAAFEREALFEIGRNVAGGATVAEHGVFFVRLVDIAAEQVGVFVGFEVGHPHDYLFRVGGGGDGGDAFGQFVHVEIHR